MTVAIIVSPRSASMISGSNFHSFSFAVIVTSRTLPVTTGFDDSAMKKERYTMPPPIMSAPTMIRVTYLFILHLPPGDGSFEVPAHSPGKRDDQDERDEQAQPPIREERRLLLDTYPECRGESFLRGKIRASGPELRKCPVEAGLGEDHME